MLLHYLPCLFDFLYKIKSLFIFLLFDVRKRKVSNSVYNFYSNKKKKMFIQPNVKNSRYFAVEV